MFLVGTDYLVICSTPWRGTKIKINSKLQDIIDSDYHVDKAKPKIKTLLFRPKKRICVRKNFLHIQIKIRHIQTVITKKNPHQQL